MIPRFNYRPTESASDATPNRLKKVGDDVSVSLSGLPAPTAGDTYQLSRGLNTTQEYETTATTYDDSDLMSPSPAAQTFTVTCSGTIRLKLDLRVKAGAGTASCRITKNGVLVSTQTNTSNSFVTRNVDIAVVAGDKIKMNFYKAGLNTCTWRNTRITSGVLSLGIG